MNLYSLGSNLLSNLFNNFSGLLGVSCLPFLWALTILSLKSLFFHFNLCEQEKHLQFP